MPILANTTDLHTLLDRIKQVSLEMDPPRHYQFELQGQIGDYGSLRFKFHSPAGMSVDARYVYVADKGNNRIVKLDHNFTYWDEFRIQNDQDYPLSGPVNLGVFGPYVMVTDTQNHRMVQFRDDGTYVTQFGQLGISAGSFDTPTGVAQNGHRDWVVVDQLNNRIQLFSDQGQYRSEFGTAGASDETLKRPTDIVSCPDGTLVVADSGAAKIQLYSEDGRWISGFTGRFTAISGIAIDERGMVLIVDPLLGKVFVYSMTGEWVGEVETPGPVDVACWGEWVFVTDQVLHCVRKYRCLF
jgi:DNA-binding beta-propeller fold protein YncE